MKRRSLNLFAALGIVLAGFLAWTNLAGAGQSDRQLALFGTIPIYWGETAGIEETLSGTAEPHWARNALEQDFELVPLDTLSAEALQGQRLLLLAQPRGLSPQENVALDQWVRTGGKVLLFADPLLTSHSRFGIGDKRRPQDVALLSPILDRWGLALSYDAEQGDDLRQVDTRYGALPIEASGTLALADGSAAADTCDIGDGGLIASCRIGDGNATVVADATLFEFSEASDALQAMTRDAFPDR